jgi:cold shock CspA family protein
MGRSHETFNKKEKEKKKAKKRQDKAEKMEQRKAGAVKGKSLEDMMVYLDENGNLSSTPMDPKKKLTFNHEDIEIGVAKRESIEDSDEPRKGTITNFNTDKGFGFIKDDITQESIFVHVSDLVQEVKISDKVTFETEKGPKGLRAIKVAKA